MKPQQTLKQLVDWRAVVFAGVISGTVFLALTMWLTNSAVGSAWLLPRIIASVVMGERVLPPPATFDAAVFGMCLLVHLPMSVAFAALIATVLHRWGLLVGVVGGAAFGLALYAVNFYTMSAWFPQFLIVRGGLLVASHVVFGALAGGIYELLEVEEFVSVEE